jgi:hypothetical protein
MHESIGGISPFQVQHGAPARDSLTSYSSLTDQPVASDEDILKLPVQFADAVKISTQAFFRLATVHDQYVKEKTAESLNAHGHSRKYVVGDKVKIYFQPTPDDMAKAGRRSNHVTCWRGPFEVSEVLSDTAYRLKDLVTLRTYERHVVTIRPYHARKKKNNKDANFDAYSMPMVSNEILALRDEPQGPIYIAIVLCTREEDMTVQYYGTKQQDLTAARFHLCWHLMKSDRIVLSDERPAKHVPYEGIIDYDALAELLVARNLQFTTAGILAKRSRLAIGLNHDELFRFE